MKRWLLLFMAVTVLGCAVAGWLRFTRTDLVGQAEDYGEFVLTSAASDCYSGIDESEYYAHLEEELSNAGTIVRALYRGERRPMYNSTLSMVEVLEVYKGDANLSGTVIGVYERNFFFTRDGELLYRSASTENLMREGKEYYLFLDELEVPRSGQRGLCEYTLDWAWSKLGYDLPCLIPCADEPAVMVVSEADVEQGRVRFSDVIDADYICASEDVKGKITARDSYIKQLFGLG